MTGRSRQPDGPMHRISDALAGPLPPIEDQQTRDGLGDYLEAVRPLADQLKPGALRTAMRRHIVALQRRIDEYDAQEGDTSR